MSNEKTRTLNERALALGEMHLEAAQSMIVERRFAHAHRQLELAAEQFAEANERDLERHAWERAGLVSQRLGAMDRSTEELLRAIALARVPGLERELAVSLSHLGTVLAQRGLPGEAAASWHEALELAEGGGDLELVAAVAGNIGRLELGRGALEGAERAFLRALAAAEEIGDEPEQGALENALGELERARGDLGRAQMRFESALRIAQRAHDTGASALAFANLGNIARVGGHLQRAETLFEASLRLAEAVGDVPAIARSLTNLGNLAAARGQSAEARRRYVRALELDRQSGQAQAVIGGLVNLANLEVLEGHLGAARERFIEAIDKLRPLRSPRTMSDVLLLLGQVEARLGHLGAAEQAFAQALDLARQASHRPGEARLRVCLAALDHARGHVRRALGAYREAVQALEAEGVASDIALTHLTVADCALAAGELDTAEAAVKLAEDLLAHLAAEGGARQDADEAPAPREALDVQAMQARLALSRGEAAARERALAVASTLEAAEREVDALHLELVVADERREPVEDGALAEAIAERARALALEPLTLDAESLAHALAPPSAGREAVEALERASARAAELGLGLLHARVRRRLVEVLLARGEREAAEDVRSAALAWARGEGALEEAARLEGLGAT